MIKGRGGRELDYARVVQHLVHCAGAGENVKDNVERPNPGTGMALAGTVFGFPDDPPGQYRQDTQVAVLPPPNQASVIVPGSSSSRRRRRNAAAASILATVASAVVERIHQTEIDQTEKREPVNEQFVVSQEDVNQEDRNAQSDEPQEVNVGVPRRPWMDVNLEEDPRRDHTNHRTLVEQLHRPPHGCVEQERADPNEYQPIAQDDLRRGQQRP